LATGGRLKLTVTSEPTEHVPFVTVQVKTFVPYSETVTVAAGLFAEGVKVAVPVPLVMVQVPAVSADAETA
jgi:hypothetical protein